MKFDPFSTEEWVYWPKSLEEGSSIKKNGARQKAARIVGIELDSNALRAPQGRAPSHSSGQPLRGCPPCRR